MIDRCNALEHLHSAWVDGELRTMERARLASHLQRCARCRSSVQSLRITQGMVRSLPTRRLPVDALAPAGGAPRRRRSPVRVLVRSLAGALATVIALGVAAFAAGGEAPPGVVPVRVDVYVASHLGRTVGGAAWTPALLKAQP